jgi:hypothetical protein
MNIQNHTLYDKDLIIKYNKYYLIDFIKKNFSIIAVFTLGFSIYMFIEGSWENGLMLIGFVIVYLILTVLVQKITTARALKKSPLIEHPIMQNYTFTDQLITISGTKNREVKYEDIIKIQTNEAFLLFYDVNRKTFIVDLAKFEKPSDITELKSFLSTKTGRKIK